MEKKINLPDSEVTIRAREWRKGDKHRIYFSTDRKNGGQACWDVRGCKWVKVKYEFGASFKDGIAKAFSLTGAS